MRPLKDLTIIIVNYKTREFLRQCLHSIENSVEGLDFEIYVVDNNSNDGSVEMLIKEFPEANLIVNRQNLGFAKACNQGIRASESKYVLLLNPDTIIVDDAINHMVNYIKKHPSVGGIGPHIIGTDKRTQLSYSRFGSFPVTRQPLIKFLERFHDKKLAKKLLEKIEVKKPKSVTLLSGACLMLNRKVLESEGLLDENMFMYVEVEDLCYGAKKNGWEMIYYPYAEIIHYGRESQKQADFSRSVEIAKSMKVYFGKHFIVPAKSKVKNFIKEKRRKPLMERVKP